MNETILAVPWDDKPEADDPLLPGPVGEYLEVVDIDPASSRFYEPVDLNARQLLAQDGWPPSVAAGRSCMPSSPDRNGR